MACKSMLMNSVQQSSTLHSFQTLIFDWSQLKKKPTFLIHYREKQEKKLCWLEDLDLAFVIRRFYINRQSLEKWCVYILSDMEQLWLKVNEALCSHESTILESFPVIYRKCGCIFPSNQHAAPRRMCWLPGLCHLVSAWAPTVNPPPQDSSNACTDPSAP